jgi:hypothetical protein
VLQGAARSRRQLHSALPHGFRRSAPRGRPAARLVSGLLERRHQPTRLEPMKLRNAIRGSVAERLGELVGFKIPVNSS